MDFLLPCDCNVSAALSTFPPSLLYDHMKSGLLSMLNIRFCIVLVHLAPRNRHVPCFLPPFSYILVLSPWNISSASLSPPVPTESGIFQRLLTCALSHLGEGKAGSGLSPSFDSLWAFSALQVASAVSKDRLFDNRGEKCTSLEPDGTIKFSW